MKLSEIKGEKAIEVFADLLEPVGKILTDKEIVKSIENKDEKISIIKKMLKKHPNEIINILAILDDVPVEKYEVNFATLPLKLIELFNDEMIIQLFTLEGQNETSDSSGSATENIKDVEN